MYFYFVLFNCDLTFCKSSFLVIATIFIIVFFICDNVTLHITIAILFTTFLFLFNSTLILIIVTLFLVIVTLYATM